MRVGTKLLLLAMLPVGCVIALVVVSAVSDYRTAHRLTSYRAQARLSFALAPLADDLATSGGTRLSCAWTQAPCRTGS